MHQLLVLERLVLVHSYVLVQRVVILIVD